MKTNEKRRQLFNNIYSHLLTFNFLLDVEPNAKFEISWLSSCYEQMNCGRDSKVSFTGGIKVSTTFNSSLRTFLVEHIPCG